MKTKMRILSVCRIIDILQFIMQTCAGTQTGVSSKVKKSIPFIEVGQEKRYLRPCYFTNWSQYRQGTGRFLPEDYTPGLCSHILFAFGWMNEDFTARAYDSGDLDTSWSKGMYSRVNSLKKLDPHLKTLLSFGGWTFGTRLFKKMAKTFQGRRVFIDSVINFVRKHDFDGIDIDWEYPNGPADREHYFSLIKELHEACEAEASGSHRERLLVSGAVSAGERVISQGYNIPGIAKYFDFVLLMSYDFHGAWEDVTGMNSPLYPSEDESETDKVLNVNWAANHWHEKGMPKEKIVIGMATYGRGWTLDNPENNGLAAPARRPARPTKYVREAGVGAYYEFCEMLHDGAIRVWNSEQQVPYLIYGNQWFGYDDQQSFRSKLKWIKQNGYGGAFVWTLDFDDFNGNCPDGKGKKYPLISLIAEELLGRVLPTPSPPVTISTQWACGECFEKANGFYPDPFNCGDFLLCLDGKNYSLSCPGDLLFSKSVGYCVHPSDSDCDTCPGTKSASVSINSTKQTFIAPTSTSTTTETTTTRSLSNSVVFFSGTIPEVILYRCVSDIPHRFSCPTGLCFDSTTNICRPQTECNCKPL